MEEAGQVFAQRKSIPLGALGQAAALSAEAERRTARREELCTPLRSEGFVGTTNFQAVF